MPYLPKIGRKRKRGYSFLPSSLHFAFLFWKTGHLRLILVGGGMAWVQCKQPAFLLLNHVSFLVVPQKAMPRQAAAARGGGGAQAGLLSNPCLALQAVAFLLSLFLPLFSSLSSLSLSLISLSSSSLTHSKHSSPKTLSIKLQCQKPFP